MIINVRHWSWYVVVPSIIPLKRVPLEQVEVSPKADMMLKANTIYRYLYSGSILVCVDPECIDLWKPLSVTFDYDEQSMGVSLLAHGSRDDLLLLKMALR